MSASLCVAVIAHRRAECLRKCLLAIEAANASTRLPVFIYQAGWRDPYTGGKLHGINHHGFTMEEWKETRQVASVYARTHADIVQEIWTPEDDVGIGRVHNEIYRLLPREYDASLVIPDDVEITSGALTFAQYAASEFMDDVSVFDVQLGGYYDTASSRFSAAWLLDGLTDRYRDVYHCTGVIRWRRKLRALRAPLDAYEEAIKLTAAREQRSSVSYESSNGRPMAYDEFIVNDLLPDTKMTTLIPYLTRAGFLSTRGFHGPHPTELRMYQLALSKAREPADKYDLGSDPNYRLKEDAPVRPSN